MTFDPAAMERPPAAWSSLLSAPNFPAGNSLIAGALINYVPGRVPVSRGEDHEDDSSAGQTDYGDSGPLLAAAWASPPDLGPVGAYQPARRFV